MGDFLVVDILNARARKLALRQCSFPLFTYINRMEYLVEHDLDLVFGHGIWDGRDIVKEITIRAPTSKSAKSVR